MVCAGCKNLDAKKKSDGKNGGSVYYCKKMKKYIRASDEICKSLISHIQEVQMIITRCIKKD